MPQYVVIQADPLPKVAGDPDTCAIYRINAPAPADAAIAIAAARKETGPVVLHVVPALSVIRYTTTPTTSYTATPG